LDWLITSEWETLDRFLEWEKMPKRRESGRDVFSRMGLTLFFSGCEQRKKNMEQKPQETGEP